MLNRIIKKYCNLILIASAILFGGISCDKEISRTPVEPEPSRGFIFVSSTPPGFTIFQKGRNTGRITPDSLSFLEPGNYEITLKRKYYKDTSITVNLSEDEKKQLQIDYLLNLSMYGKLFLDSEPAGASIILNDSVINHFTPYTVSDLQPGEYNVKLRLPNHRDAEISAIVQSSQTTNYSVELRDTSEWVDYQTINSGIQSNSLTAIAIDQNNVKWIGSLNNGLIRYDEISFTNYDESNSLIPDNRINCISIDNQNRAWVGTDLGIGVFDGSSWIVYNISNSGLTSDLINIIRFDISGAAWIGTSAGQFKYDGVNWIHFDDSLSRDWIEDFYIESENKIWLATKRFGIFIIENGIITEFPKIDYNYPSYSLTSVAPDQLGNIWFCFLSDTSGRNGVAYWDGNSFTTFTPGNSGNAINHIFIDEQNNKWVSTSQGFILFDPQNSQTVFTRQNSFISSDLITSSVRDLNGNVWVMTQSAGLNKYKPSQ